MFGNEDDDNGSRLKRLFWKAIHDSPFMMLGLEGVEDDQTRPMSAQVDATDGDDAEDGGDVYFFASKTDGVGQHVSNSQRAVATFSAKDHTLFAHVHGTLTPTSDKTVVERLWNPFVASWYKDGKDDPDLLLLRFNTENATIWEADRGSTLKAAMLKSLFNVDPGKEHSAEHKADITL